MERVFLPTHRRRRIVLSFNRGFHGAFRTFLVARRLAPDGRRNGHASSKSNRCHTAIRETHRRIFLSLAAGLAAAGAVGLWLQTRTPSS